MDKTGELIGKKIEKEVDISQFFTSDGCFYEAGLDAIMKDLVDIHYLKQKDQQKCTIITVALKIHVAIK